MSETWRHLTPGDVVPRPADLFDQAMERGEVRLTMEGKAWRADLSWNGLQFAGIGPTMDAALSALEFHIEKSKAGVVRP